MCDVNKVWSAFCADGWFDELFPTDEMKAVVRTEVIAKLPEFLAPLLDKPVSVPTLLEAWLAYTKHYLAADVYGQLMAIAPVGLHGKSGNAAKDDADKVEGEAAVRSDIVALERAVVMAGLPSMLRVPSVPERKAQGAMLQLEREGHREGMTVRELAEVRPLALMQMG